MYGWFKWRLLVGFKKRLSVDLIELTEIMAKHLISVSKDLFPETVLKSIMISFDHREYGTCTLHRRSDRLCVPTARRLSRQMSTARST